MSTTIQNRMGAWSSPLKVPENYLGSKTIIKLPPAGVIKMKKPKQVKYYFSDDSCDEDEEQWNSDSEIEYDLDDDPNWWGSDDE